MADFGILANQIAMQHHQEQERQTIRQPTSANNFHNSNMNNQNQNFQAGFTDVPTIFVQSSSVKSNRSNKIVSKLFVF